MVRMERKWFNSLIGLPIRRCFMSQSPDTTIVIRLSHSPGLQIDLTTFACFQVLMPDSQAVHFQALILSTGRTQPNPTQTSGLVGLCVSWPCSLSPPTVMCSSTAPPACRQPSAPTAAPVSPPLYCSHPPPTQSSPFVV